MKIANLLTWILLVALTISAYFFSEGQLSGHWLVLTIMGISIIKFNLIGWQFVEIKHAHPFWKIIFTGFIFAFSFLVYVFY